jgi:hypothetical protein
MENFIHRFRSAFAWVSLVVVLALTFTILATSAQSQGPSTDDLTRAFVSELRLLRIAVETLAGANSRVQILSMRAGRHDQRLASLSDQLIELRLRLTEITAQTSREAAAGEELQERIRVEADPMRRQEMEVEQRMLKGSLNSSRLKQAALQAEVDQLTRQTFEEQSRLTEIQQRLDGVERLLAQPRQ